ncbi:MAG: DUF3850 domain-containing protein [Candidatus Parcubacteria bacterium]|nr:DUF3850 domain-containing protein [Candidatus Parcubacteria bacterium]
MAVIKKKTWPEDFELISQGIKKYELRVADFDIQEGDTIILEEWNPETKEYTGRNIEKKVGYMKKFSLDDFGQKEEIEKHGLYIIQLED